MTLRNSNKVLRNIVLNNFVFNGSSPALTSIYDDLCTYSYSFCIPSVNIRKTIHVSLLGNDKYPNTQMSNFAVMKFEEFIIDNLTNIENIINYNKDEYYIELLWWWCLQDSEKRKEQ